MRAFFLLLTITLTQLNAGTSPAVLVIGGGPAGLATALEAHTSGARVLIVEKREHYSRQQPLILTEESVELLDGWRVELPEMKRIDLGGGREKGLVQICHLEQQMRTRLEELKVPVLLGSFAGIQEPGRARIELNAQQQLLPYDLLVGADGLHSAVRDACCIPTRLLGLAEGFGAFIHFSREDNEFGISEPVGFEHCYVRRIAMPHGSLIFAQGPTDHGKSDLVLSGIEAAAWDVEKKHLLEGQVSRGDPIELRLQQAERFSNQQFNVALVGDAAAAASFFEGLGANTGLQTAHAAGELIRHWGHVDAFGLFDQTVQAKTDLLIDANRYLFGV